MIRHGEEVEMTTEEASGGQKRNIVRYVLMVSLGLAIIALSIIWITGAATGPENPAPDPQESVSDPVEAPEGQAPLPNPNPATNAPDARNGTQLPLAPKFTWTIGTSYERDLGGFKMYLDTDFRHVSRQFSDLGEQGPIAAYGIWNGSIGFSDPDDNYRVSFLARNITDKAYALLNVSAGQRLQIPRDADRYFGISLRARLR